MIRNLTMSQPSDEHARMQAVESLGLLDTPPEADFDEAVRMAAVICKTPISLMTIVDHHRQWFKAKIGLDVDETPRDQAFCAHAIGRTSAFIVPDAQNDPRFLGNPLVTSGPKIRFYAGMPLHTSSGHTIGTLCVIDTVPRELTFEQQGALTVLGRQISIQIELRSRMTLLNEVLEENARISEELRQANRQLEDLANTDSLTRLRNRRAFDEGFDREFAMAAQDSVPLSLLMLDIDHFKTMNDRFGHASGDDILCTVARILTRTCRTIDLVARHGGEEFAVLLPKTSGSAALVLAERVRAAVEGYAWPEAPVTISVGIAGWDPAMNQKASMFRAADDALYEAKNKGRNRIVLHEGAHAVTLPAVAGERRTPLS